MQSEFYGTEIFLDNEYTREYLDICRSALKRGDDGNYFEEHMIIPMDFWRFLPWAVGGRLGDAMPREKRVYCKLTPEEHFRCHEIMPLMFPTHTKEHSGAVFGALRLQRSGFKNAAAYGDGQRARNRDWRTKAEIDKYCHEDS